MKIQTFNFTDQEQGVIASALNHYFLYNLERSEQKEVRGTLEEEICRQSSQLALNTLTNFEQQQDGGI